MTVGVVTIHVGGMTEADVIIIIIMNLVHSVEPVIGRHGHREAMKLGL